MTLSGTNIQFSLLESVHRIISPASSLFGRLLHPRKAKRYSFHPYCLMFIFCQRRRHDCRRAFSLLESVHRIAPPASSLFGKLLHPRKAKRYSFHPYRLMFIFSQRRRHDCHMAFFLPESVHRIAPPASNLFGKLLHLTQNKSGRASTIPLDVYLFPK